MSKQDNQIFHVPFLPTEWTTVKGAFENRTGATCFEALQVLSAWRLRSSSALPFTVQASEVLIKAVLNDPVLLGDANRQSFLESENVRLVYGMAITRFINYVSERERERYGRRGSSIADICKGHGIPNWVVDVRHAATHGNLPSLNALREAIDFCWGWLRTRYWNHELLQDQESSSEVRKSTRHGPKLARRMLPSMEASTSGASSACWPLADEDVVWADLPIGLGPGQQLKDLDLRVRQRPSGPTPPNTTETEGRGDMMFVEDRAGASVDPPAEEWNDQRRLDLVETLISFVGE